MNQDVLYTKSSIGRLEELKSLAPESYDAFMKVNNKALASETLTAKQKELIAVAVAHTTGCAYCIELHIANVKEQEASKEEVAEAIMVASALKAGSALAHSVNALNAFDGKGQDELYKGAYFERLREFAEINGETTQAFMDFDKEVMSEGHLTVKEKELIAVAVAHTTGCAYCINIHTKGAKKAEATFKEISEAIMVATTLKAGSALAHGINALNAYDR
ncbi:carboxymuconolactone decarboxylase family protein [Alteribacter keqinensis]|uniref:Alkylhydroperoxidase n=1 Tax=Alteribacter keqinensis TaxID=2483800 RepID=A0A3M7TWS7_9BACI|nr:carboxymuconolactone decarboxylase family protein [Alteribacter keqinensis]RNA69953.1 alkylhydroperoxidase [Alteribacter keqinensis]